jgi:hypothetical protein
MPYVLILVLMAGFGSGYATAWKHDQSTIARLETSILIANKASDDVLNIAKEKVAKAKEDALDTQKKLEAERAMVIESNAHLADDLASAKLQYARATASDSCPVPKTDNPSVVKKTDGGGTVYLSTAGLAEGIDRIIQAKATLADKRDQDLHFVLEWLNTVPTELIAP